MTPRVAFLTICLCFAAWDMAVVSASADDARPAAGCDGGSVTRGDAHGLDHLTATDPDSSVRPRGPEWLPGAKPSAFLWRLDPPRSGRGEHGPDGSHAPRLPVRVHFCVWLN